MKQALRPICLLAATLVLIGMADAPAAEATDGDDPAARGEVRVFEGHKAGVIAVDFVQGGKRVLSCGEDKTIRLWDVEDGKELHRLEGKDVAGVWSQGMMAVAPDGKRAAFGEAKGGVTVFDLENWKAIKSLERLPGKITCLTFSPDGKQLLCSAGNAIQIWDAETGKQAHRFPSNPAYCLAISPDGKRLAVGLRGPLVQIWDLAKGHITKTVRPAFHTSYVTHVEFFKDSKTLAAATFIERVVSILDAESAKELRSYGTKGYNQGSAEGALTPDFRTSLHGLGFGLGSGVVVWDLEGKKELHHFKGHKDNVTCVAFSADGRFVLSGSADKTVRLWRAPDAVKLIPGKRLRELVPNLEK